MVDQLVVEAPDNELAEAAQPPASDDQDVATHLPDVGKQIVGPALDHDGAVVETGISERPAPLIGELVDVIPPLPHLLIPVLP